MHRQVGAALFQRGFQLLDEQALAADLGQRAVEDLVAARGHAQQFDLQAEALLQQVAHMFGLPQGQAAFAGGDDGGVRHGCMLVMAQPAMRHRAARLVHGDLRRRIGNLVTSSGALHAHRHPCRRAPPQDAMPQPPQRAAARAMPQLKNRPLVEDIRLLGRILGDVIREQEGKDAFELIERVRQLSVAYRLKQRRQRRARARPAAEEPVGRPDGERDPRLQLLLAPGQHRRGPPPRAPPRSTTSAQGHQQEGSLAMTLRAAAPRPTIRAADIAATLQHAYISPVLTAHPTEVQRKSILDAERAIAELVGERDDLRHRARARRQRGADARPRHAAVADAHAAHRQADRGRRDRERAELLPRAPSCARSRACTARSKQALPGHEVRALPAHGQLDRRRPRRQPQRHAPTRCAWRWRARPRRRCAST